MSEPGRRAIPLSDASDGAGQVKRWRAEFPYHWDADDLVSRRELLQLAVYTSGALFGCTAILALLGLDHTKLTYPYLGRNFRLTDVGGKTDLVAKLRKG